MAQRQVDLEVYHGIDISQTRRRSDKFGPNGIALPFVERVALYALQSDVACSEKEPSRQSPLPARSKSIWMGNPRYAARTHRRCRRRSSQLETRIPPAITVGSGTSFT